MKRFYFFVGVALSLLLFCPAHAQDSAEPDGSSPIPHGALTDPEDMVKRGRMAAYFDANNLALPPVVGGVSAILMDADNRQILWEQNADARREPASTTKILTALLFVEATKPQEIITCNDPSLEKLEESLMHIPAGEKFTADNLLNGVMVRSANDGAVLMAERVAGTVPKFAEKMNARAKQLGAFNSQFFTPNGLHDPRHYSTARDIALIACAALKNPRFAEAVRLPERIIQRSIRKNNVLFIAKSASKFHQLMPEADGVKSGYTRQAGHCFVGSATREGRRLLVVVLGSPNAVTDSVAVLNWGFARFPVTFFARKGEVVAHIALRDGEQKTVPAIAINDLHVTTDRVDKTGRFEARTVLRPTPSLFAPVKRGQEIGVLVAYAGTKPVAKTILKAGETIPFSSDEAAKRVIGQMLPYVLVGAVVFIGGYCGYRYVTTSTKNNLRRRTNVASQGGGVDSGG